MKLKFQETSEIVKTYADDLVGYQQLQTFFKQNAKVIQYVYANLFPRYFFEFDSVYKRYLAQKNVLNWQFYSQIVAKSEETWSTQNNFDETEEQKDFHVEKTNTTKETTDSTVKEIVKKKKKIASAEQKTVEKNSRKKTKTNGWSRRK